MSGKMMRHARGLLMILALGVMLACSTGTAYASYPPSPAPVTTSQNKATQANANQPDLVSVNVGDFMTDASIGLFVILILMFWGINFLDGRKNKKE